MFKTSIANTRVHEKMHMLNNHSLNILSYYHSLMSPFKNTQIGAKSLAWAIITFALTKSKLLKLRFENNIILLKIFADSIVIIYEKIS